MTASESFDFKKFVQKLEDRPSGTARLRACAHAVQLGRSASEGLESNSDLEAASQSMTPDPSRCATDSEVRSLSVTVPHDAFNVITGLPAVKCGTGASRSTAAMPATESDGASRDNVLDGVMVPEQDLVPSQQQQLQSPWQQRQRLEAQAETYLAQRSTGTQTPEEWHSCAGACHNGADAAESATIRQQLAALMQERDSSDAAFKAEKERWTVSQETLQQRLDQAISALDAQRTTLGQISAAAAAARLLRNDGIAVLPSSSLNDQGGIATNTQAAAGSGAGNTLNLLNDMLGARDAPDTQRSSGSTGMHDGGPPLRNAILTMTVESVQRTRVQKGTGSHGGRGGAMPEAVRRTSTAPGATVSASSFTWDGSHRFNMQRDTPVWPPAAPVHATYQHPPRPQDPPHNVDAVMADWQGLALPAAMDGHEDAASESRLRCHRNGLDASTSCDLKMPSLPTSTFPTHRGPFIVGMNGDDSAGDGDRGDWARHRITAPLDNGPPSTPTTEQVDVSVARVKRSPSSIHAGPGSSDDAAAPACKRVAWRSESDSESPHPAQPMAVPNRREPLDPPVAPPLPPPPSQGLWGTTDGQQGKLKLKEAPGLVRVLFVDWDGVTKHTRRTVEEAEAHLASLSTPPSAATMIFHCFSRPPGTRGLRARVPLGAMWDAVFHATPRLAAYRHACRVFTDTCNAKDLRRSSSPSRMHGFHESIFTAHDAVSEARAAAFPGGNMAMLAGAAGAAAAAAAAGDNAGGSSSGSGSGGRGGRSGGGGDGSGGSGGSGGGGGGGNDGNGDHSGDFHSSRSRYNNGGGYDMRSFSRSSSPALSSPTSSDGRRSTSPAPLRVKGGSGSGGSAGGGCSACC